MSDPIGPIPFAGHSPMVVDVPFEGYKLIGLEMDFWRIFENV